MVRKRIASIAGVALASTFSFFPITALFARVEERIDVSGHVLSMILMLTITAVLSILAFGVEKRPLSFFGIRRFCWRDIGAMLLALVYALGLILVATLAVRYFLPQETGESGDPERIPLAVGLTAAVVAGITEEFIYRGFLIEELGELIRNRSLAGAISVVLFALSHHGNYYGWSIELLYPGLFGVAITLLYFWRRNLLICILMHAGTDILQYWRTS